MAGGSGGQSRFLDALNKTQAKKDGGFANNWSFAQSEDNEGDAERDEPSLLNIEESSGSDSPCEEPKSKQLRPGAIRVDSMKTYEKRAKLANLRNLKGNPIGLNMLGASKKLGDNTQNISVSQGTVLHGRRFHHANSQMSAVKTAAQRKEYPPHLQKIDVDQVRVPRTHSIVYGEPESANIFISTPPVLIRQIENVLDSKEEPDIESGFEIKRKVQQKCRSERYPADMLHSPAMKTCPSRLAKHTSEQSPHSTLCPNCGKENDSQSKCQCSADLQRHSKQGMSLSELAGPLPRPAIHQHSPAQKSYNIGLNAKNFYGTDLTTVPTDIWLNRELGRNFLPTNGKVGPADAAHKTARTIKLRGVRPEMSDPIVLSSDDDDEEEEEDDEEDSIASSTSRVENTSPRPADSACSSPAPSSGKVEAAFKENNSKVEERLSSNVARDAESTVPLPRKARMKDQFGNAVASIPVKRRKVTPQVPSTNSVGDSVILNCRLLQIGTFASEVLDPVVFGLDNIKIRIKENVTDFQDINLKTSDLSNCQWCNSRLLSLVFLQTIPAACQSLRSQLKMSREKDNVWYDCKGTNPEEQYILLVFEGVLDNHARAIFEKVMSDIGTQNKIADFATQIRFEEAKERLGSITKSRGKPLKQSLGQHDKIQNIVSEPKRLRSSASPLQFFEDDDEESGESHSVFIGPIVKLIVYPPPPAKGGISVTNEDLHCLNEGEFLNDVIIDFYLKYLVLEKLRKDADRIHMFSSFFYKRLNQRERRNYQETANLSLQQRRHGRVKTWTRHVDIFQKDFLFVPLNEAAHWFLAVICFPGLNEPQYEPNPLYQGAPDNQDQGCTAEEDSGILSQNDSEFPLKPPLSKPPSKKTPSKKQSTVSNDGSTCTENSDTMSTGRTPCRGKRSLKNGDEVNLHVQSAEKRQTPNKSDFRTKAEIDFQSGTKTPVKTNDALDSIRQSYSDETPESNKACEDELIDFSEDQDNLDESSDEGGMADEAFTSETGKWHLKALNCKQPCILLMDSLRGPSRSNVVRTLREYLEVEWEVRKGSKRSFSKEVMKGSNPRVPQQNNFSDCGVYILQYVESFFENPIHSFDLPMNLSGWFPEQRMKTKREEIRNLILQLQELQNKDKKGQRDLSSTSQPQEETEKLLGPGSTL
ncbi:sentrin-specific protease 6 isoform X3 [Pleurodeles waltl]|uniref:sentrin-specific protease 6 isoform X3 n=2 Tax=Pleurodeles waltl TaxID=8319 RepID=UPI0037099CFA